MDENEVLPGSVEENTQESKKVKKQKKIPLFSAIVLALILCVGVFISTFTIMQTRLDAKVAEKERELNRYSKFGALIDFVEEQYVRGIDENELFEDAYAAILNGTKDPYSCYMTAEEYEEYSSDRSGSYVGIGVNVIFDSDEGVMRVFRVTPDSPAEKAGIKPGDLITKVGKISVSQETYNDAVESVKGERGTTVTLSVRRGQKELPFTVTRDVCPTVEVIYEKIETTAYIQILSFRTTVAVEQFSNALKKAKLDGCTSYLFDVRNNPGGDLGVICDILDQLIKKAVLVHMVDAKGNDTTRETKTDAFLDAPMAVLCNKNSASAAELFTADLRDNKHAYIVGKTTYGKGTMQTIRQLTDGSAIKLTNRYYNPTSNVSYDGIGIKPDLEVELPGGPDSSHYLLTHEEDTQLQAALDYLRK